ncbi:MAG TPA: hypothetical protein VGG58_01175, partial [Candidatus Acidoferrum sp.]
MTFRIWAVAGQRRRGFGLVAAGLAVLLLGVAGFVQAQQGQSAAQQSSTPGAAQSMQQKIAVEVKVVNLLATVRDKRGKTVANLTKDDFVLAEDGKPQTIAYFARESDLPLRLGLLVDTSLSQRRVLGE